MCHVMRREARSEDDHNLVNRRRGARRQRQMQESRKRSSCTLCTQLSFPSLFLSLSLALSLSFTLSFSPSCFLSRILSFDSMRRLLLPLFNKRQRYAFRNIPVCTEGFLPQLLRYIPCPNNRVKSMIPDSLKF